MTRRRSVRKLLVGCSLLLVVGCSAATTQTGLVATGSSLIGVGNQFVAVGVIYAVNCTPTIKDPKFTGFCAGFKEYAPQFQRAYPIAQQAWKDAVRANDVSKAQGAMATIMDLATSLTTLVIQATGGQ